MGEIMRHKIPLESLSKKFRVGKTVHHIQNFEHPSLLGMRCNPKRVQPTRLDEVL